MKSLSIPRSIRHTPSNSFNAEARSGGDGAERSLSCVLRESPLAPRLRVKIEPMERVKPTRRLLPLIAFAALLIVPAAHAQSGFPFTNEVLKYSINWPSGLSLGEATFTAQHTSNSAWEFDMQLNAAIPGFALVDHVKASATTDLCSTELNRDLTNGSRKTREKTTFDQTQNSAHRLTTAPADGGESTFSIPSCARDALTYVYYGRRELGQGRVPQAQSVYFGGPYAAKMDYTGAQNITVGGKSTVTDHLVVSVKGPKADFNFEVFYARDAARTPVAIRIPLPLGALSIELVP
jgi:hypothetical protein